MLGADRIQRGGETSGSSKQERIYGVREAQVKVGASGFGRTQREAPPAPSPAAGRRSKWKKRLHIPQMADSRCIVNVLRSLPLVFDPVHPAFWFSSKDPAGKPVSSLFIATVNPRSKSLRRPALGLRIHASEKS